MRPDPSPDDVRFALGQRISVLEGRSAVVGPCHLKDALGALDSLDAKAFPELTRPRVIDELPNSKEEGCLLRASQRIEVGTEPSQPFEGGQSAANATVVFLRASSASSTPR